VRFIHCADLHLDTPFSGLSGGSSAEIRQAELRQTFLSIVELARGTDALIISGDLFDQDAVEPETIRTLTRGFASLGETRVLIAAGNHDPLVEKSYYRLAAFSPNVHIFGPELERVTVADCDIYGISFRQMNQTESLLAGFCADAGRPSVMVMHGNLGGQDYNPLMREAVETSGLSYLALGHVHSHSEVKLGQTLCVYPGCPEGRGFDELGAKGVVSAEVTEAGVKTAFVPVCRRRYYEITTDITGLVTQEELIGAIKAQLLEKQDLYKIVITGEAELVPRTEVIKEAFADFFFVKIYDRTKRPIDLEALSGEPGLRGLFARKIAERRSEEADALYNKALSYGLSAMAGEKVKLR